MGLSEKNLQELWDRMKIAEALYTYPAALDERGQQHGERERFAAFDEGFTRDAVFVDYLEPGSEISRNEFINLLTRNWSENAGIHRNITGQHLLSNIRISIDGDMAKTRAEYISISVRPMADSENFPGRALMVVRGGFYEDDLIRTPDGWRIVRHKINKRWDTTQEALWPLAQRPRRPVNVP